MLPFGRRGKRSLMSKPEQVTQLLHRWKASGDTDAEHELFVVVEHELLKVARAALARNPKLAHKLDPRELIAEAYLALQTYPIATTSRGPFFALMARAMRNFLVDLARRGQASKRPPTRLQVVDTKITNRLEGVPDLGPIEFYDALDALAEINKRQAEAIQLRIFGLELSEIAAELDISLATVKRDLAEARAFLALQLGLPPNWV
jgi:RNA polymerase sigma factor (TIGR02999 family)